MNKEVGDSLWELYVAAIASLADDTGGSSATITEKFVLAFEAELKEYRQANKKVISEVGHTKATIRLVE